MGDYGWLKICKTQYGYLNYSVLIVGDGISVGNSFVTIVTPFGTSPVADDPNDILTFTSTGLSIAITGDAVTDTINFDVTALTTGSVMFAGSTGLPAQDNANFFWDDTNNRLGIGTATPSARLEVRTDAIGNSIADTQGIYLRNATAATGGSTQQHSPPIVMRGNAWKTNATAASQTVDFRQYTYAVNGGTATALGRWRLEASINGAAYGERFGIDQSGAIYLTGSAGTNGQYLKSQGSGSGAVWGTLPTYPVVTSGDLSLTVSGTYDAIINVGHTNVWTIYQAYTESSHSSTTSGEWWNDINQHSMAFNLSGSSTDNAIKVWPTGCFYSMYEAVRVIDAGEQDMMVQI